MTTLTVASKYQIVIPARMRESLDIRPGKKLHAIEYRGHIELVSLHHGIPMGDSVMLATARRYKATFWTQGADFEGLDGVRYFAKA